MPSAPSPDLPTLDRPILLYKTRACPYCVAAGRFLRETKRVPEHLIGEIDLTFDDAARVALARASGQRTVPQIWIGGTHIGGYDDLRELDRRGGLDPLLPR